LIETSGHYLDVGGIRVDARRIECAAGTWLLDSDQYDDWLYCTLVLSAHQIDY